jgi:hypothetical protein
VRVHQIKKQFHIQGNLENGRKSLPGINNKNIQRVHKSEPKRTDNPISKRGNLLSSKDQIPE